MTHTLRAKSFVFTLLAILTLAFTLGGCGGYQPSSQSGKCADDRKWVPPQQDAEGNWKDGYCSWEEGKAP